MNGIVEGAVVAALLGEDSGVQKRVVYRRVDDMALVIGRALNSDAG
jgi:hypothetical protein